MTLYTVIEHHLDFFRSQLKLILVVCVLVGTFFSVHAQEIKVKPVKVNEFEESSFAPFVKNGWLYFASNKRRNTIYSVQTEDGFNFFDLYKVQIKGEHKVKARTIPLSDSVNGKFDEVSVFIESDSILYFTSNSRSDVKKDKIGRFGIYTARIINGEWGAVRPFQYNDSRFNVGYPAVNSSSDMLVFSSDNIAGEGMSDLYYCRKKNGQWTAPQNLGINFNTEAVETFPFFVGDNILYFSSDRKGGIGKLDIYKCVFDEGKWSKPELLPEPINSKYNDFNYFENNDQKSGYFASDRIKKTDGIFYFKKDIPDVEEFYQQELYFCYFLEETKLQQTDTLVFEWNLGDGTKQRGTEVDYCYSDTGTYHVTMNIIDKNTGLVFDEVSSYDIVIDAKNKPVIDFEDIKKGVVRIFMNTKWTNVNYTNHYWIVDGILIFDDNFIYKFKDKDEVNVKLIAWDKNTPNSEIGIERIVYK